MARNGLLPLSDGRDAVPRVRRAHRGTAGHAIAPEQVSGFELAVPVRSPAGTRVTVAAPPLRPVRSTTRSVGSARRPGERGYGRAIREAVHEPAARRPADSLTEHPADS
ncbi:hypothetical protein ACVB8X_29700 [Streptomyces sp. NRAIS4]